MIPREQNAPDGFSTAAWVSYFGMPYFSTGEWVDRIPAIKKTGNRFSIPRLICASFAFGAEAGI